MEFKGQFKGRCASCGCSTKRTLKNMKRPCPKCGGAIELQEEEKPDAALFAVICIIGVIVLGVIYSMAGVGQ